MTAHADMKSANIGLPSSGMSLVRQATLIKPIEPDKTIHFTVWLKLRNKKQLDQLVNEIYDPNSASYQRFLTSEELTQQYVPSQAAEDAVQRYFTAQGMDAEIVNHTVRVTAKIHQVEQALQVKMNYYRFQNRTVYANATAPSLSVDLAPLVLSISGLSDMAHFKPNIRSLPQGMKQKKTDKSHDINMAWESFVPFAQPTTTSIGGFSGKNLKTAYNLANITPISGTPINGAGQTIIITDECGINTPAQIMTDGNVYNAANGLPAFSAANFAIINPNGTPFTACETPGPTGWETEIAVDIVAAHTIAPGANIVLVLAPSNKDLDETVADIVSSLISNNHTIAGFPNAFVVSNSWGEQEGYGYWPMEPTLELAAVNGINFNFSSGDCGDDSYASPSCSSADMMNGVQYPASSAYVTAIGGTSMFVDNSWNYAFETVWGTYFNHGFFFGGGGGVSQYFGPVAWQSAITFFTAGGYGPIATFNKRALPDISMVGDPITGLTIFEGGAWHTIGGTSLASPLFSGTLALVNQVRTLKHKGPIGLAAPYFYTHNSPLLHSKSLHIIQAPRQIISGATLPPTGAPLSAFTIYDITFGWDSSLTIAPESQFWNDAVGVGSPNIPNFVNEMATF